MDLIEKCHMSEQTRRYQAIRRVLEDLVANYPFDHPIAAYVAACYYLGEHCEDCGARLPGNMLSIGSEGARASLDLADTPSGDITACVDCLARRRPAVV
ncbi:MAG TPA: hypothetical protein VGJ87_20535 [Roseiflexaceae bacterium]|jgi:hypothetical protein